MDEATILLPDEYVLFKNDDKDYELDSASIAQDKADKTIGAQHPLDFNGHNRMEDGMPDIGAFEYYKKENETK